MKALFDLTAEIAVVTGALGKLGSIWIETLLDAGASVFALDLPDTCVSEEFKHLQTRFNGNRLALNHADVRDRRTLEVVCKNCLES